MNIGYFFWGHLSDKVSDRTRNTPDGNAWYSSSIIHELDKRGHNVFGMAIDRDKVDYEEYGNAIFNSFESKRRITAYNSIKWVDHIREYPKLDILLLEWRFPIPGRNCMVEEDSPNYQADLFLQTKLLDHYRNTKIIIFDLDYKLTHTDELYMKSLGLDITVFETSSKPKSGIFPRVSVDIPFWMKDGTPSWMDTPEILKNPPTSIMSYIGSNYEREDVINKYIIPFSENNKYSISFYGNWLNYPETVEKIFCDLKWRYIKYYGRVGHTEFLDIYSNSIYCPLLAKQEYLDNGFITARIQECVYFGSIPLGLDSHYNIENYILYPELIIKPNSTNIKILDSTQRYSLLKNIWRDLEFMDVSYFIDKLLKGK